MKLSFYLYEIDSLIWVFFDIHVKNLNPFINPKI